ncbi:hypothetical protein JIX56_21455 [Streptomyces sp. CA-210063]|uniref:hypothetical protein n=1 Tax=Streptomyces sp. CA-210063 TaxID=2801029 RepID=UPI00214BD40A|nr:hypothetical protein [Streptomyces sp. CA-210063]UUU32266.1 hypothetical protein JIX56_21455 [Streptomyces sp. CA-210063]
MNGADEEKWSQLLTFTVGGRSSVVKQTAVRTGTVVVVVSGSVALLDVQVAKAVDKAHGAGLPVFWAIACSCPTLPGLAPRANGERMSTAATEVRRTSLIVLLSHDS